MEDVNDDCSIVERPNILDTKVWSSQENVRSWIDNLTESELVSWSSEASSPTKNSFENDVFLQLPDSHESDDLALGAEAKYYGYSSHTILSPSRLSPLISHEDNNSVEFSSLNEVLSNEAPMEWNSNVVQNLHKQLQKTYEKQLQNVVEENCPIKKPKLRRMDSIGSWTSSFDRPSSLAAALLPDPEELLYSLGFCETKSTLQYIPSRFFQTPSDAFGINVDEIHNSLIMEHQESLSSYDSAVNVIQRFSESSIELTSHTSSESAHHMNAKNRRILFQSSRKDVPSIHLSQEDNDRPFSPLSAATSNSSSWMRLETLEEVPEPISRNSSFESDRLTNLTISAFLAASQNANLRMAIEGDRDLATRRYSDNSRGDTLTDENADDNNDVAVSLPMKSDDGVESNTQNLLHAPITCKHSISDKSVSSSIVTVVDAQGENLETSLSNKFKPINEGYDPSENRSFHKSDKEKCDLSDEVNRSSSSKRFSFKTKKSKNVDSHDDNEDTNVRETTNIACEATDIACKATDIACKATDLSCDTTDIACEETDIDYESTDIACGSANVDEKTAAPADFVRKFSKPLNDSLREFFRKLKKDVPDDITDNSSPQSKRCIQIVLTSPEPGSNEKVLLDKNGNEENTGTEKKPTRKSYLSAAFDTLTSAISKYNDSKPSNYDEIVVKDDIETSTTHDQPKQKSSMFRLFNHQTFAIHSNSAFSAFASGLVDGKVNVDCSRVNDTSVGCDVKSTSNVANQFEDQFMLSDSSYERNRASPLGYIADSPSSDDCTCPTTSTATKKRKVTIKKMSKGHSFESSGFDEDHQTVKCPVEDCYIRRTRSGKYVPNSNELYERKGEKHLKETSREISSYDEGNMLMTHTHYDFLVQQFTALRKEMREGFNRMEDRTRQIEVHVDKEIRQTNEIFASTYMEWMVKEMNSLKHKLQEKDDEIRRLQNLIDDMKNEKT